MAQELAPELDHTPALFPLLRGLIDQARRHGQTAGQYLLLGSASWDLLQPSGETLAGRVSHLDMTGLTVLETGAELQDCLWLRGGFPDSLQSPSEARSLRWNEPTDKAHTETEFERYRIGQDRLFESGFDRVINQIGAGDRQKKRPCVAA